MAEHVLTVTLRTDREATRGGPILTSAFRDSVEKVLIKNGWRYDELTVEATTQHAGRPADGTIVYVYGQTEARVVQGDADGAIVRELDDMTEGWHPWERLLTTPTTQHAGQPEPLRFRIEADDIRAYWGNENEPWRWYVRGNRPDAEGDLTWGNFPTWHEAHEFVLNQLAFHCNREDHRA